jgi:Undecaprenyl-phosphate galactose phosphotransferase WbaP
LAAAPGLWQRVDGRLEWFQQEHRWPAALIEGTKRAVDLLLAGIGGLLVSPLMIVVALLIKWQAPGPVFYSQQRIGRDGRRFMVWKFRTMICDADRVLEDFLASCPERREEWDRAHKLQDDPRITAIGHWLRKTSLDELPQLWNVLRGEMSLVGPRPIVSAEICKYEDRFAAYCSVLPGITGLWQVSGRSDTTYAERVELDSYYARNHSLWLDFYILLMTVKVVLFRQGAY